jgi:hypothetical protein
MHSRHCTLIVDCHKASHALALSTLQHAQLHTAAEMHSLHCTLIVDCHKASHALALSTLQRAQLHTAAEMHSLHCTLIVDCHKASYFVPWLHALCCTQLLNCLIMSIGLNFYVSPQTLFIFAIFL